MLFREPGVLVVVRRLLRRAPPERVLRALLDWNVLLGAPKDLSLRTFTAGDCDKVDDRVEAGDRELIDNPSSFCALSGTWVVFSGRVLSMYSCKEKVFIPSVLMVGRGKFLQNQLEEAQKAMQKFRFPLF